MNDVAKNLENKKKLAYRHLLDSPLSDEFEKIAKQIGSTNPRQILYHWNKGSVEVPVCPCGALLSWHPDKREYRKYCSKACTARYSVEEKKQKNLKTLGVEWHSQTDNWKQKVDKTSARLYGAQHYSQTEEYKQSVKQTTQQKYGVDHVMKLDSTKQKVKAQWQAKYSVDNPAQASIVQNKIKQTNQKKYGVDCVLKNKNIQERIKNVNLEKYGFENPAQNSRVREKIISTRRKNYYPATTLSLLENQSWLQKQNTDGKTVAEIANELAVSPSNLSKIFHQLQLNIVRHQHSAQERKLYDRFCDSYAIDRNTRSVIGPKEIDLYFKDYKLGVEINGIYFHSEKFHKTENYHLEKTLEAQNKGISLLHFWDFEIESKTHIVENLILSHLGGISSKINARQTKVIELDKKSKKNFLDQYHLQGNCASSIDLGLVHKDNLVMIACFSPNRFSKKAEYELVRLCSAGDTSVRGGVGKLISYFSKKYMKKQERLVSYADRRYSNGNVYEQVGFKFSNHSPPGFFYVDRQGNHAGSRHRWQKHLLEQKLDIYDSNLPAEVNMKMNNYYRVWDCGQSVYIYTK